MEFRILTTLTLVLFCLAQGCSPDKPADDTAATAPKPVAAPQSPPAAEQPAEASPPVAVIDVATLALKIDPACKMSLEEYPATATAEFEGKTYGFCSSLCQKKFLENPEKILARLQSTPPAPIVAE